MKFGLNNEQRTSIQRVFSLYPNIDKVIIFGSRVKGNWRSGSDIDLALIGERLRLDELFKIGAELESLSFPMNFDLLLYKTISDKDVLEHIRRIGILFYKRTGLKEKGITPLIAADSRILILGTFPSDQSILREEYYANSTNQFWKILFNVFNKPFNFDYDVRRDLVLKNRIALWDVLESCIRNGSSDKTIKEETINNLNEFSKNYPSVVRWIFNGKNAYKFLLNHHFDFPLFHSSLILSSTSRLNTHSSLNEKTIEWSTIKNIVY